MAAKKDYYELLGVHRGVADEEIRKAYRRLALKYHPDRNPGSASAEQTFKEISGAYDVLSDPEKRRQYDQFGHEGLRGFATRDFSGASFEDIFSAFSDIFGEESLFGDAFGIGRRRGGPPRGPSLRVEIEVTFEEAIRGTTKTIALARHEACDACGGSGAKTGTRPVACPTCGGRGMVVQAHGFFSIRQPCPSCGGQGQVVRDPCPSCRGAGVRRQKRSVEIHVPPGVEDGTRLRLVGQGEAAPGGGRAGDLYCDIAVRPHPLFRREGADVACDVPIPYPTAVLGGEVAVPTLDGETKVKIPKGTVSGQLFRLRGLGIQASNGRGDQFVRALVDVPSKVSKREEELLKELAKAQEERERSEGKTLLERLRDYFGRAS